MAQDQDDDPTAFFWSNVECGSDDVHHKRTEFWESFGATFDFGLLSEGHPEHESNPLKSEDTPAMVDEGTRALAEYQSPNPENNESVLPEVSSGVKIIPSQYNFYPSSVWDLREYSFSELRSEHFMMKSNKMVRFQHKLWNALQITQRWPDMYQVVGVLWFTERVVQVNKEIFGRLLGLEKATSALFNIQGSFPTHGFREVTLDTALLMTTSRGITEDARICRYFVRPDGLFRVGSSEDEIAACRYQKPG